MPLAHRSATTTSMPRFSMVRRPRVDTRRLTKRLSVSSQNRWVCRFGRKRRRLRLFAWDTVLPVFGPLPVTWQTRDMILTFGWTEKSRALYQPQFDESISPACPCSFWSGHSAGRWLEFLLRLGRYNLL